MCGIFGNINSKKARTISGGVCKMISNSFVAGSLRGDDSSGIMQVDNKGQFVFKSAQSGPDFVNNNKVTRFINDSDVSWYTVGHNRAATEGLVTEDNAHPFTVFTDDGMDRILGVHNGTLAGWKSDKLAKGILVDSEWALTKIAAEGNEAFKSFEGSFCFVWSDTRELDKLFMVRNDQRPMYFTYNKEGTRMFFASEPGMLAWVAERNYVAIEDKIYLLESGFKYAFEADDPKKYTKTKLEFKKAPPAATYSHSPHSTATTYSAQASFITKLESAIRGALGRVTDLVPTTPAVVSATAGKKEQVQSSAPNLPSYKYPATEAEATQAFADGVWNSVILVALDIYDEKEQIGYGTVVNPDGTATAEAAMIRNIGPRFYMKLADRNYVSCYVAGICMESNGSWLIGSMIDLDRVPTNKIPALWPETESKVIN